jgi:hypothetical protein
MEDKGNNIDSNKIINMNGVKNINQSVVRFFLVNGFRLINLEEEIRDEIEMTGFEEIIYKKNTIEESD